MRILTIFLNNRSRNSAHLYAEPADSFQEADFESLCRLLRQARDEKFTRLYLAGADPLGYSKFEPLLAEASALGYIIDIEIGPSDIKPHLPALKNCSISGLFCVFCGADAKTNAAVLGDDYFQKVCANIGVARENNLPINLRYLITRLNFLSVGADLAFFEKFKFGKIFVEDAWPVGRGAVEDLAVRQKDVLEYWPVIKKNRNKINFADNNFQEDNFHRFIQGQEVVIDWNGDVKPFPFSSLKSCGNISRDKFKVILKNLSAELNRLVFEASQENRFLNWGYHSEKFSGKTFSQEKNKHEYGWQIVNNVVLPSSFSILLTQQCNFNCDFCEFECSPQKTAALDIQDFEKLLKEGKRIGVSQVIFDGGEPLLHPEINEMMALCAKYGYGVTILTSGWYFNDYLPQFKKYNIHEFIFGINAATAKTNDLIMGKEGAFDRLISAIKKSKELGFFTGLHLAIHPLNVEELDLFFDLAQTWKVDYIMTSRIIEVGRAKNNPALRVTPEQINRVRSVYKNHQEFLKTIQFFGAYANEKRETGCKYLNQNGPLSIHWGGEIALCSMVPLLNLPFKKIHDCSLMECLAALSEVNGKFQLDRNAGYPNWRLAENPYLCCEYCHELLTKNPERYFA